MSIIGYECRVHNTFLNIRMETGMPGLYGPLLTWSVGQGHDWRYTFSLSVHRVHDPLTGI